jgi:hypothetical protein
VAAGAGHQKIARIVVDDHEPSGSAFQAALVLQTTMNSLPRKRIFVSNDDNLAGNRARQGMKVGLGAAADVDKVRFESIGWRVSCPIERMTCKPLRSTWCNQFEARAAACPARIIETVVTEASIGNFLQPPLQPITSGCFRCRSHEAPPGRSERIEILHQPVTR